MKSYIEKQTLYYTLICSQILDENEIVILNKIAPLFTCSEEEKQNIKSVLENEGFKSLTSDIGIIMRQNYLKSFGYSSNMFGHSKNEDVALEVKESVYHTLTELTKDPHSTVDLRAAVAHVAETDSKMQVLYALLLYCQDVETKSIIFFLKSAGRDEQLDARIVLHFFAESQEQVKAYFGEMTKCSGSIIYPEIVERIAKHYGITTNNTKAKG